MNQDRPWIVSATTNRDTNRIVVKMNRYLLNLLIWAVDLRSVDARFLLCRDRFVVRSKEITLRGLESDVGVLMLVEHNKLSAFQL